MTTNGIVQRRPGRADGKEEREGTVPNQQPSRWAWLGRGEVIGQLKPARLGCRLRWLG